jgi:uncharacterized protein YxeA
MANSVKFLIIIVIVAVLVGGFIYYYANFGGDSGNGSVKEQQQESAKPEDISVPTATGGINETIDALIGESAVDAAVFSQEENDKNLLGSDSQAISNLGQSYDENEF